MNRRGFTLIEIVVVVAIAGLVMGLVFSSVGSAQKSRRDLTRKDHLRQIAAANLTYLSNNKKLLGTGSGCGSAGDGIGWFFGDYGYTTIYQCLVNQAGLSSKITDPLTTVFCGSTPTNNCYTYMQYNCTENGVPVAYIYAKLENAEQTATSTDTTCNSVADTSWGMNYYVKVE